MIEKKRGRGRPKGVKNKRSQEQIDAIMESGLSPLEYFAGIYQDEKMSESLRMQAAAHAAPYVHAKLSSTEIDMTPKHDRSLNDMTDEELITLLENAGQDASALKVA